MSVWPSAASQGLFQCLGVLTQPWVTVYRRDITKGTDLQEREAGPSPL